MLCDATVKLKCKERMSWHVQEVNFTSKERNLLKNLDQHLQNTEVHNLKHLQMQGYSRNNISIYLYTTQ